MEISLNEWRRIAGRIQEGNRNGPAEVDIEHGAVVRVDFPNGDFQIVPSEHFGGTTTPVRVLDR